MTSYSSAFPYTLYSAFMYLISSDPRWDRPHNLHSVGEKTEAATIREERREARCSVSSSELISLNSIADQRECLSLC